MFELDESKWHGISAESMWATPRDSNSAILDSVPFFAKGVSYQDIVEIAQTRNDEFHFNEILIPSGHSTYRIRFKPVTEGKVCDLLTKELDGAGCIVERASHGGFLLLAISQPPTANADAVYQLLDDAAKAGIVEIEEGNDFHPE